MKKRGRKNNKEGKGRGRNMEREEKKRKKEKGTQKGIKNLLLEHSRRLE